MKQIVILLIVLLTFGAGIVAAQDDVPLTFEIEGKLVFAEDGSIMVGDVVIAPAGAFIPADYEEGDMVIITGVLLDDDTLQAISLEEVEDEGDDEPPITEEPPIDEEPEVALHPVGSAIADEFDLEYEQVEEWHDSGLGYGQISRALLLADQIEDMSVEEAIEALENGENLNQIARDNGISPSELAQGRIISGRTSADEEVVEDGETGYVAVGTRVNIRSGAGTTNDIIGILEPGDSFVIIGSEGEWLIIQLEDGTIAYIYGELIEEGDVPEDFEITIIIENGGGDGDSGSTASNQGNDGINKFGCDGRGNSCNTPAEDNRGGGNENRGGNGNGGGNGKGKGK